MDFLNNKIVLNNPTIKLQNHLAIELKGATVARKSDVGHGSIQKKNSVMLENVFTSVILVTTKRDFNNFLPNMKKLQTTILTRKL